MHSINFDRIGSKNFNRQFLMDDCLEKTNLFRSDYWVILAVEIRIIIGLRLKTRKHFLHLIILCIINLNVPAFGK